MVFVHALVRVGIWLDSSVSSNTCYTHLNSLSFLVSHFFSWTHPRKQSRANKLKALDWTSAHLQTLTPALNWFSWLFWLHSVCRFYNLSHRFPLFTAQRLPDAEAPAGKTSTLPLLFPEILSPVCCWFCFTLFFFNVLFCFFCEKKNPLDMFLCRCHILQMRNVLFSFFVCWFFPFWLPQDRYKTQKQCVCVSERGAAKQEQK